MSEKINEIEIQGYENNGDSRLLVLLKEDDYLLLREQAELAQELSRVISVIASREVILCGQNKRYRDAIKRAIDYADSGRIITAPSHVSEILLEALEGEE